MLRSLTSRSLTRISWQLCWKSSGWKLCWYLHLFLERPHCSRRCHSKIWNIQLINNEWCIDVSDLQTNSSPSWRHPLDWPHSRRVLHVLTTSRVSPGRSSWCGSRVITWTVWHVSWGSGHGRSMATRLQLSLLVLLWHVKQVIPGMTNLLCFKAII